MKNRFLEIFFVKFKSSARVHYTPLHSALQEEWLPGRDITHLDPGWWGEGGEGGTRSGGHIPFKPTENTKTSL